MCETFLKNYKESNTADEIVELDLFKSELPYYGRSAIIGLSKRNKGKEFTREEKKVVDLVDDYLTEFFSADKIVFAFPLWNFSILGPLVTYISYLAQAEIGRASCRERVKSHMLAEVLIKKDLVR